MEGIKPFKHIFTLTEKPDLKTLGSNVKVTKKKCMCVCHTRYETVHSDPCCDNGYVWEVEIEPGLPKDMEKSGEIIHTSFHRGIHIDPI